MINATLDTYYRYFADGKNKMYINDVDNLKVKFSKQKNYIYEINFKYTGKNYKCLENRYEMAEITPYIKRGFTVKTGTFTVKGKYLIFKTLQCEEKIPLDTLLAYQTIPLNCGKANDMYFWKILVISDDILYQINWEKTCCDDIANLLRKHLERNRRKNVRS